MEPVNNCYKGLLYTISDSEEKLKGYLYGITLLSEEKEYEFDRSVNDLINNSQCVVVGLNHIEHEDAILKYYLNNRCLLDVNNLITKVFLEQMKLHVVGDKKIIQQAIKNNITIYDLETLDEQLGLIEEFGIRFMEMIQNEDEFKTFQIETKNIINAVKNGIEIKNDKHCLNRSDFKEVYKRNSEMSEKIDSLLKDDKYPFVALEYGHFLGEKSLTTLLKSKGWTVSRLNA